jgi:hypothetical protein
MVVAPTSSVVRGILKGDCLVVRSRIVILAAFLSCVAFPNVHACMPPPMYSSAPEYLRAHADHVFMGQVRAVTVDETSSRVIVKFKVSRVWKGPKRNVCTVGTSLDQGVCGLGPQFFQAGRNYLVYADQSSQGLVTGSMSDSKEKAAAQYDLKHLGRGARVS